MDKISEAHAQHYQQGSKTSNWTTVQPPMVNGMYFGVQEWRYFLFFFYGVEPLEPPPPIHTAMGVRLNCLLSTYCIAKNSALLWIGPTCCMAGSTICTERISHHYICTTTPQYTQVELFRGTKNFWQVLKDEQTNQYIWELLLNYRDFVIVMVFYP